MLIGQFELPIAFDLAATFLLAVTGALVAMRKGYDFVGVFFLALITGTGGGLLRDGLFLQQVPAVLGSPYVIVVVVAMAIGMVFGERLNRPVMVFMLVDAAGLGIYAMVGAQKALNLGLGWGAALLIGVINAVGGGLVRDVITRDHPMVFRPGEFYAAAAFMGCVVFIALAMGLRLPAETAALAGIATTLLVRFGSVRFGWRTRAVQALIRDDDRPTDGE
ncbi:MAG: TRIC cation channel family protein [Phaeospirillum sp.]|nr:TRIC cation channel family protein [Phaeospirillum sp.]